MTRRWKMIGMGLAFLGLAFLSGCTRPAAAPKAPPVVKADPWRLACVDPNQTEPALLWNGLIGLRIGRDGTGEGQKAWTISSYQATGEEKIEAIANPLDVQFTIEGVPMEIDPAKPYSQTLDMKTGLLETRWQSVQGVRVRARTLVHPDLPMAAAEYRFESDRLVHIAMTPPAEVPILTQSVSASMLEQVGPGAPGTVTIVQEVSVRKGQSSARKVASSSIDPLVQDTASIWAKRWTTDIEIDGPVEDQQAIRSFMFYLRGAVHPDGGMSVSPMGLSSEQYFGHVFWDADIWVAPALAFFDPAGAKAIAKYRLNRLDQAEANFRQWWNAGMPTGDGKQLGSGALAGELLPAAKFPWESSVSGKETVPGPSKFEDHVSGSVAWSIAQANRLGFVADADARRVIQNVGQFYAHRSVKGDDGLRRIAGTMSPDENHIGDNDLYTNLLAMWTTSGGKWPNPPTFVLPKDDTSFLTYDNDQLKGYKQAAAVLSIFPLQFPPAEQQARVMMDRFSGKVIRNGPAMTDSVHATIWARLGEHEKAYATWHESWQPFTHWPLMLFSEKRASPRTYFTTGAAGSLSAVIYGFLGFRLDSEQESGAAWSKELNGGAWLSIKPNLPPAWKAVKFKNFQLLGHSYTLTATPTTSVVVKGD